jgi:hypothetical protein
MKDSSSSCTAAFRQSDAYRRSVYASGLISCAVLSLVIWLTAFASPPHVLRVLVLISSDSSALTAQSLRRGITLGAEEAARTMAMFGDSLDLRVIATSSAEAEARAVHAATRAPGAPMAIIRADPLTCLTPAPVSATLVIDAACPPMERASHSASVGGAVILFIRPPPIQPTALASPNARAELWHASLKRFGAEQLNQRYARRFGRPMDSDAWAGWFAVKVLAEAALRAHATTAAALGTALTDTSARYDGHKGAPLYFDASSGALRQPLYVVAPDSAGGERVVGEVTENPR